MLKKLKEAIFGKEVKPLKIRVRKPYDIEIKWKFLKENDEEYGMSGMLYAYLTPDRKQIVYIGKADGRSTIRSRLKAADKKSIFVKYKENFKKDNPTVISGTPYIVENNKPTRFRKELLDDIEALLIYKIKPIYNKRSTASRNSVRPRMTVNCTGYWMLEESKFVDDSH